MPTGYTAELIEKKQSFADFAMTCAHAFGALIMMRDEPLDAPIPEFQPSTCYTDWANEARAKLAELQAMNNEARRSFGESAREKTLKSWQQAIQIADEQNAILDDMRAKVEAWTPPTKDHEELKRFMLEQIDTSKDATDYYLEKIAMAEAKTPISYFLDAVSDAQRMIESSEQSQREENNRTKGRNEWVKALRDSLKAS